MLFCSTDSDSWSRRKEDMTLQSAGELWLLRNCATNVGHSHQLIIQLWGIQKDLIDKTVLKLSSNVDVRMHICTTCCFHRFHHETFLFVCTGLQDFMAQPLWSGLSPQADAALGSKLMRTELSPLSSSEPLSSASDNPTDSNIDQTPMGSSEENPAGGSEDSFQDSLEADLQWPDLHKETR